MTRLLVTCEHGGNEIPVAYRSHFRAAKDVLRTHRGWDIGALGLFDRLAETADAYYHSTTSRLLIELNRSLHHPALFSSFTDRLNTQEKQTIIDQHYTHYRETVETRIAGWQRKNEQVVHISVHSFTPEMNGIIRSADIGLLYDPSRKSEKQFASQWSNEFGYQTPELRVRMNYPYRGTADGFTTYLRKQFNRDYCGIELEVNQKFANGKTMDPHIVELVQRTMIAALKNA